MLILRNLCLSILAIFLPIKPILLTVMALTIMDLILGVIVAVVKKQKITSNGFSRTIAKILVYQVCIMMGYLVQMYLIQDALPLVKILASLIGLTELKSILENTDMISGSNLFKALIDKLASQSDKTDV